MGHNIGLGHANSIMCTSPRAYGNTCSVMGQNEPLEFMGNGNLQYNFIHKRYLNYIDDNVIINVTSPGTYDIYPFDDVDSYGKNMALLIPHDSSKETSYVISFRNTNGGLSMLTYGAVEIHMITGSITSSAQTNMLHSLYQFPSHYRLSPLRLGFTFYDDTGSRRVYITFVKRKCQDGKCIASVQVRFDSLNAPANPMYSTVVNTPMIGWNYFEVPFPSSLKVKTCKGITATFEIALNGPFTGFLHYSSPIDFTDWYQDEGYVPLHHQEPFYPADKQFIFYVFSNSDGQSYRPIEWDWTVVCGIKSLSMASVGSDAKNLTATMSLNTNGAYTGWWVLWNDKTVLTKNDTTVPNQLQAYIATTGADYSIAGVHIIISIAKDSSDVYAFSSVRRYYEEYFTALPVITASALNSTHHQLQLIMRPPPLGKAVHATAHMHSPTISMFNPTLVSGRDYSILNDVTVYLYRVAQFNIHTKLTLTNTAEIELEFKIQNKCTMFGIGLSQSSYINGTIQYLIYGTATNWCPGCKFVDNLKVLTGGWNGVRISAIGSDVTSFNKKILFIQVYAPQCEVTVRNIRVFQSLSSITTGNAGLSPRDLSQVYSTSDVAQSIVISSIGTYTLSTTLKSVPYSYTVYVKDYNSENGYIYATMDQNEAAPSQSQGACDATNQNSCQLDSTCVWCNSTKSCEYSTSKCKPQSVCTSSNTRTSCLSDFTCQWCDSAQVCLSLEITCPAFVECSSFSIGNCTDVQCKQCKTTQTCEHASKTCTAQGACSSLTTSYTCTTDPTCNWCPLSLSCNPKSSLCAPQGSCNATFADSCNTDPTCQWCSYTQNCAKRTSTCTRMGMCTDSTSSACLTTNSYDCWWIPTVGCALKKYGNPILSNSFYWYGAIQYSTPNWQERQITTMVNMARMSPTGFASKYTALTTYSHSAVEPLYEHYDLDRAARSHSSDMNTNGCFSDSDCNGWLSMDSRIRNYYPETETQVGEVIDNTFSSAESTVKNWFETEASRTTILNSAFKVVGSGYVSNKWTQNYGSGAQKISNIVSSGTHFLNSTHVSFLVTVYNATQNTNKMTPIVKVSLDGTFYDMTLLHPYGDNPNSKFGTFGLTIPKISSGPCRNYIFVVTDAFNSIYYYPAAGALQTNGEGSCGTSFYSCGGITSSGCADNLCKWCPISKTCLQGILSICPTQAVCNATSMDSCTSAVTCQWCSVSNTCAAKTATCPTQSVCSLNDNSQAKCFADLTCTFCNSSQTCISKTTYTALCELPSCYGVAANNINVCSGNGDCTSTDKCNCNNGFTGTKCETPVISVTSCYGVAANNVNVCSGKGNCTSTDKCNCNNGFTGTKCETPVVSVTSCYGVAANNIQVCSGNGECTNTDKCVCNNGFTGTKCETPVATVPSCYGVAANNINVCSGKGNCTNNDKCVCLNGFYGQDCSATSTIVQLGKACNSIDVCADRNSTCLNKVCTCNQGFLPGFSSSNKCVLSCFENPQDSPFVCSGNGKCATTDSCTCNAGFTGQHCERAEIRCNGILASDGSVCGGLGKCTNKDTCVCNDGSVGVSCFKSCFGVNATNPAVCNGHGECKSVNVCNCKSGYKGTACETPVCNNNCNGQGVCNGPNTCKCNVGYSGNLCETFSVPKSCVNLPTSTKFCNKVVSFLITYSVSDASNKSHADYLFSQDVLRRDGLAELSFKKLSISLTNCSSTDCVNYVKQLSCFDQFPACSDSSQLPMCLSTCKSIISLINDEKLNGDTYCATTSATTNDRCFYGSFLPPTTTCYNISFSSTKVCSSHGQCVGSDMCSCVRGYQGSQCSEPVCGRIPQSNPSVCSGHGSCISPETCSCQKGYSGRLCETPTCNGKIEADGGCSLRGLCGMDGNCTCYGNFDSSTFCSTCKQGFMGDKCDMFLCNGIRGDSKEVCSGNGQCTKPGVCTCNDGFSGKDCQLFSCYGLDNRNPNVCNQKGSCIAPNKCSCNVNWDGYECKSCSKAYKGTNCTESVCNENTCNGHGTCNDQFKCVCSGNFVGPTCSECLLSFYGSSCDQKCTPETCNNNGVCNNDGTCLCKDRFNGTFCEPEKCSPGFVGRNCDYGIISPTFGFNKLGDSIIGTIFTTITKSFKCNMFISEQSLALIGGDAAVCIYTGRTTDNFIIKLGPTATITNTGQEIELLGYPGNKDLSTIRVQVLEGEFKELAPNAVAVVDKKMLSKCDMVVLDASSSSSLDRRSLKFSWQIETAPINSYDYLTSALVEKSHIFLNGSLLDVGDYTLSVTVKSDFSTYSAQTVLSFSVRTDITPKVNILNGFSSTSKLGSITTIIPQVTFPSCYGAPAKPTLSYIVDVANSPAVIDLKTKNDFLVFGGDYTKVTVPGEYTFIVTASAPNANNASISFKVTFIAQPLEVKFSVTDFTQSVEDKVTFDVLKYDPSGTNEPESLIIECFDTELNELRSVTAPYSGYLNPGTFKFTATYSKGSRQAITYLTITVVDVQKSKIIRVGIDTPKGVDLSAVDPTQNLILAATIFDSVKYPEYTWTSDTLTITEEKKSYLSISPSMISPGQTYVVAVSVADETRSGSVSLSFTTNSPPTIGLLSIEPSSGKALTTSFALSCGNGWSDEQTPLSFQFQFFDGTNWAPLNQKSEAKSLITSLPAGTLPDNMLRVKVVSWDNLGAFSEHEQQVQVAAIGKSEALSLITNSDASALSSQSFVSSAISVISQINATSEEEKQEIRQATSAILKTYLESVALQDSVQETSSSVSVKLSVMVAATSNIEFINEEVSSQLISQVLHTTNNVAEFSMTLDLTILGYIEETLNNLEQKLKATKVTRSILSVEDDLRNLRQSYENLMKIKDNLATPDMPANTISSLGSFAYSRKMKRSSLDKLEDTIDGCRFNLSSTLSDHVSTDTVFLKFKLTDLSTAKQNLPLLNITSILTRTLEFSIMNDSTNSLSLTMNNLATLTFGQVRRRLTSHTEVVCAKYDATKQAFIPDASCYVGNSNQITISSVGTYVLMERLVNDVAASIPIQSPQPAEQSKTTVLPTNSNNTEEKSSLIGLVALIAIPIILVVVIIVVVVIVLLVHKRKKNATPDSIISVDIEMKA